MVRRLSVLLLLVSLATAPDTEASAAQADPAGAEVQSILAQDELTLADFFRLAKLTNPTLMAAENGVQAMAGRARQAGHYPNPTFGFEVEELSVDNSADRKDKVSLVQPLVLGGRRGAAAEVAQAELEVATAARASVEREVFRRIHTLCFEQLYFRQSQSVFDELLVVANRTLEIVQIRFDARAAPESQVTKALLEVYDLEFAQRQMQQAQVAGAAELASLFWGVEVPLHRLTGTLDGDTGLVGEALGSEVLNEHPAFQAALQNIAAADASLREARASPVQAIDFYLAYGRNRAVDEGFVEAGISLPLPLFNRNEGRIAERKHQLAQARDHERVVVSNLEFVLTAAHQRYLTARDQLQATGERILPAAERGLLQAQEGYRVGHLPILELIDAQRTLASVRLRTLELKKDVAVAEADLMSLVGGSPYAERETRDE